jgi:hypothetical protein
MSQYAQSPTDDGKLLDQDDQVIDLQAFLESGAIVATAVASAGPVTPIGTATVPTYDQIPPKAQKFIGSDNQLYDLLEYLESGNLKVQVDGVVEAITGQANEIEIENGMSDNPTVRLAEEIQLRGGLTAAGDINLGTSCLTSAPGTGVCIEPSGDLDGIDLKSSIVRVHKDIVKSNDATNRMQFDTDAQSNLIGNVPIFNISAGGWQLGAGHRVNLTSNNPAELLDTVILTAYAVQLAISNAIDSGVSFRGGWDASSNTYPTTGGTGDAGAIESGNWWYVTVGGTLGGTQVYVRDTITALVNAPGQTGSNWLIGHETVSQVFGRSGAILAQTGDYTIAQITNGLSNALLQNYFLVGNGSNVASPVTAQAALNTLAGATTSGQYLGGNGTNVILKSILSTEVQNQHVTVTLATQALAANTSYASEYVGLCVMSLPTANCPAGSIIIVKATVSGATFKITQAAGQSIRFGSKNGVPMITTVGVTGYVQSTAPYTNIVLQCTSDNTTFDILSCVPNINMEVP